MKRTTGLIAALFACALIFSCANGLDSGEENTAKNSREAAKTNNVDKTLPKVAKGYLRINTLSETADNLWIWNDFDPSATAECKDWNTIPGGFKITGKNGDFKYADIKLLDAPQQVGFIVRDKENNKLSGKEDIIYLFPAKYNEIFLKAGGGSIYIDSNFKTEPSGLASAMITGENTISATIKGIKLSKENTKVFEADGTKEIEIASISGGEISVSKSLKETGTVYVQYSDEKGTDKRVANFDPKLIDEWFVVDKEEIKTFGYKDGVFTTWAPLSSGAKVLLFENADDAVSGTGYKVAAEIPMSRSKNGTWKTKNVSSTVGSNKYYKYSFFTNGVQYDVCDIWAKSASKNSVASAIEELKLNGNYKNPFGSNGSETKKYNDAVIYEMHITDWSQAFRSSVEKDMPGTFKEITAALGTKGDGRFGQHLRELGVTHVQILPMFEYAVATKSVINGKDADDKDIIESSENDNAYNWGYNPYNWNTPESRYVQNMKDGSDAVEQMREMINAFHDAGISVIMDVVYNHTSGTGDGSIYDKTVPKYFYRMDSQGNYSNGSGCGNETASEHAMVRKYMIDSLKHWMNDYHINGFRFDLMGLHDQDTMKEIYTALSSIDKNVLVYGEPWDAGSNASQEPLATSAIAEGTWGVGAFDDDFRDAVKGGEYSGFQLGQVQSANSDSKIVSGLIGANNGRNSTGISGLALHYAECHDNYTLFDKLVYSTIASLSGEFAEKFKSAYDAVMADENKLELIKKEEKLAAAYVLLSQGTPFINGGQEFMRTKKGNPDSYAADKKGGVFWDNIDDCNAIDLKMKETYSDVYDVYRGLIALRRNYNAFTDGTKSTAKTLAKGVTLYNAKSDSYEFEVYFNASDTDYTIPSANLGGNLGLGFGNADVSFGARGNRVEVSSGKVEIDKTETLVQKIPAKSFVILKK